MSTLPATCQNQHTFIHTLAIVVTAIVSYWLVSGHDAFLDEGMMHMPQINQLRLVLLGERSLASVSGEHQIATMIPSYHWLIAGIFALSDLPLTLNAARLISLCFALLTLFAFYWAAHAAQEYRYAQRTWQALMLPVCLPFLALIYTDIPCLLFTVLSFGFYFRQQWTLAGTMACLSLAFRQTHLIWFGLLFTVIYIDSYGYRVSASNILNHCKRHWLFIAGAIAFGGFVYWNGGIAMGRYQNQHLAGSLFLGNVFFCMQAFFIVFLPWLAVHCYQQRQQFRKPLFWVMAVLLCAAYLLTSRVIHPWNIFNEDLLRNQMLHGFISNPYVAAVGVLMIPLTAMAWATWPMRRPSYTALFPFLIFALLPVTLIEPRYYLPAFMLFLLFSAPRPRWQEYALLAWLAGLSAFVLNGHLSDRFFL